ncbi:MAG: hypothetical protein AAF736_12250 [Pseudomonadota bacterium]
MKHGSLLIFLLIFQGIAGAAPLESAFSYQGELQQGGQPASGQFDFSFALFDADTGGSPLGSAIELQDVAVVNGIFTVQLDFGISPFAGDQLWLEIEVGPDVSAQPLEPLLPRQPVSAVPYALHAEFVAMGSVGSGEIASGAVGSAQIDESQVQQRIQGTCSAGTAVTAISESGQVTCQPTGDSDWSVSQNFVTTDGGAGVGGATGPVGAGTFVVQDYDATSLDSFGGMYVDVDKLVEEKPFYGYAVAGQPRAFTEFDEQTDQFRVWNGAYTLILDREARLGVGGAVPEQTLHVQGDTRIEGLSHFGTVNRAVLANVDGDLVLGPQVQSSRVKAISHTAFDLADPTASAERVQNFQGVYLEKASGFFADLFAPLDLPNGSVITALEFFYVDDSVGQLTLQLRRNEHATNSSTPILSGQTSSASANVRTLAFLDQNIVVNNQVGTLYLAGSVFTASDFNLQIRSARVTYVEP